MNGPHQIEAMLHAPVNLCTTHMNIPGLIGQTGTACPGPVIGTTVKIIEPFFVFTVYGDCGIIFRAIFNGLGALRLIPTIRSAQLI